MTPWVLAAWLLFSPVSSELDHFMVKIYSGQWFIGTGIQFSDNGCVYTLPSIALHPKLWLEYQPGFKFPARLRGLSQDKAVVCPSIQENYFYKS